MSSCGCHLLSPCPRKLLHGTKVPSVDGAAWRLDSGAVSELLAMVDRYRDEHGQPSDASVARGAGIARQTISSWRIDGVKRMPTPETLQGLAQFLKLPLEAVVMAAARDAGYLRPRESDSGGLNAPAIDETG